MQNQLIKSKFAKKVTNHKNLSGQATKAKILAHQFQSIVYVIQINQKFKHA